MQSKSREADNGHSTEAYLRYLLGNLDPYQLLTILSLGRPNKSKAPAEVAALLLRSCSVRPSDGNAEDKCRYALGVRFPVNQRNKIGFRQLQMRGFH